MPEKKPWGAGPGLLNRLSDKNEERIKSKKWQREQAAKQLAERRDQRLRQKALAWSRMSPAEQQAKTRKQRRIQIVVISCLGALLALILIASAFLPHGESAKKAGESSALEFAETCIISGAKYCGKEAAKYCNESQAEESTSVEEACIGVFNAGKEAMRAASIHEIEAAERKVGPDDERGRNESGVGGAEER